MDDRLKQAVLAAGGLQGDTSNPLGASMGKEIANLASPDFFMPALRGATTASASHAQDVVAEQKRAAAAAKAREDAMKDPRNYRVVPKEDGGFDFFDPEGKQVDIATYAKITGQNPVDIIKDSKNPIDIQYVQDYNNLQGFMEAVTSQDTKKVDAYVANEPALEQYRKNKGGLHNLLEQFQQNYQRYYVPRSQDPRAWGASPGGVITPAPQYGASYNVGGGDGIGA